MTEARLSSGFWLARGLMIFDAVSQPGKRDAALQGAQHMPDYLITVRAISNGAFTDAIGATTFLKL
jgi:hypothetical protein